MVVRQISLKLSPKSRSINFFIKLIGKLSAKKKKLISFINSQNICDA